MRLVLFAAVAVVGVSPSLAIAGEGGGDPFPFTAPAAVTRFEGHQALANKNADPFPFRADDMIRVTSMPDGLLPSNGSQGAVQTANSLPPGFANGTPAFESARIMLAYQQNQERAREAANQMAQNGARRTMVDRSRRTRLTGPG